MPTTYDWSPFFNAVNGQVTNWGQRGQMNSMLDALSGKQPAPNTGFPAQDQRMTAGDTTQGPNALAGINPQMLQMLRSAPPGVSMPLLLQLGTQQRKYSQTPQYDQQGNAFVLDDQGNMKPLPGVKARTKVELTSGGDAYDPYNTAPGTHFEPKANPNQPFNPDGSPNKAYQEYEAKKMQASQAPQWANVEIARNKQAMAAKGLIEPDTLTFMAQQVLAGDKSPFSNIGRGAQGAENLAALRGEVMRQAQGRGLGGADLAALNAEFAGLQAGERTLGNRTANIEMAANEARNLMPLALEASKAVNRTSYPTLNKIIMAAEQGTGDENVVKLGVAVNGLVNTYARAISPTGAPTVSDKDHAREILDKAWSNGQFATAVAQMDKEIAAAQKSPGQVRGAFRSAISGKDTGHAAVPDGPSSGAPAAGGGWAIKLKGQ